MALVKCPECGREKVSDTAVACPDCGFGVKAYFDKIKQQEERKEQERKEQEEKQIAEDNAKKMEEERIKSVPKPSKPRISCLGLLIGGLICWLGSCKVNTDEWERQRSMWDHQGDPVLHGWLCLIFGVGIICYVIYSFVKQIGRYNLAQTNFEEYQRLIIREKDAALAAAKAEEAARARKEAMKPECPYCHSRDTTKISVLSHIIDMELYGIEGQNRSYQWHCCNCHSDF